MQLKTLLRARVPRANCPEHGPQTIRVPWADPMARFTLAFEAHAIDVLENARSTTQACELLKIGWATADRIMERGVARGLERRKLEDLSRVGMDEKSFLKGIATSPRSTTWTAAGFLKWSRPDRGGRLALWGKIPETSRATIKAVAMDMWQAFENAARRMVPERRDRPRQVPHRQAPQRRSQSGPHRGAQAIAARGRRPTQGDALVVAASEDNLTDTQYENFRDIKDAALKTSKAWFIKEAFRFFWVVPKTSAEAENTSRNGIGTRSTASSNR